MPVYFFTYHAYLSWLPNRPRGFVQKNTEGVQSPSRRLAEAYRDAARDEPVVFTPAMQRLLLETAVDVCQNRQWRLHAGGTDMSHVHLLVGWRGVEPWRELRGKLKHLMSLELSQCIGPVGRAMVRRRGESRTCPRSCALRTSHARVCAEARRLALVRR